MKLSGMFVSGISAGCAVQLAREGDWLFAAFQAGISVLVFWLARRHP